MVLICPLAGCYMAVLNFSHIVLSVDDSGQSCVSDCCTAVR